MHDYKQPLSTSNDTDSKHLYIIGCTCPCRARQLRMILHRPWAYSKPVTKCVKSVTKIIKIQAKQDRKGFRTIYKRGIGTWWNFKFEQGMYVRAPWVTCLNLFEIVLQIDIWCFIRFCLASNWTLFCLYLDTVLIIFDNICFCLHFDILLFAFAILFFTFISTRKFLWFDTILI